MMKRESLWGNTLAPVFLMRNLLQDKHVNLKFLSALLSHVLGTNYAPVSD